MKSAVKNVLYFVLSAVVIFTAGTVGHIQGLNCDIADSVLRLHVIANSNSVYDQEIKLKVRDGILKDCGYLFYGCKNPSEAAGIAKRNTDVITASALKTLFENGVVSSVDTRVEQCSFPTKEYGTVRLPSGRYTAVNVKIGAASGRNWWCVMYPPLCLTASGVTADDKTMEVLRSELSEEEYDLITQSDEIKINLKFKLAEIIGRYFN